MSNILNLLPVLVFLILMLSISVYIQRSSQNDRKKDFAKDYFIGGRTLGGFVLAMTTAATYSSVSTFVGGPGMAWIIGYGWLYMAIVQVVVIFLVLGVFGKKIALVARHIDAVTVIDVLRARYQSNALANLAALVIVAFFCTTMVAQFVGAAKLFEAVTGFSYFTGLTLFGLIVVIYTTIGGFKGVAVTDACCAIAMIVGLGILLGAMMETGGGFTQIMQHISTNHPDMLEPFSAGKMPLSLYISQWLLVGICTLALPQSVVRGISFKNTRALHRAMIIGTIVIGAMTLVYHPTEVVSDKIPAVLCFFNEMALHITRGVRWDSDHVVILDDETKEIAQEIVRCDALDRVHIALDYFDASINRISAWVTGFRSVQKALLNALVTPSPMLKELQDTSQFSRKMVALEDIKMLPLGDVWEEYCRQCNVPAGDYYDEIDKYEKEVLVKRV